MLVLFIPAFHSGTLVIGLALLALTLRIVREGYTFATGLALWACCVGIAVALGHITTPGFASGSRRPRG